MTLGFPHGFGNALHKFFPQYSLSLPDGRQNVAEGLQIKLPYPILDIGMVGVSKTQNMQKLVVYL